MRIATWNLDAQGSPAHQEFLTSLQADVLLLTEVPADVDAVAFSSGTMARGQHYAALRGVNPLASSLEFASVGTHDSITCLSSVLPWRGMGGSQAERMLDWLRRLDEAWPSGEVVWGGDWNQELYKRCWVGCREGQEAIKALLERRGLQCPTTELQMRNGGRGINHIAVPASWHVTHAALVDCGRLSDHEAVVVDVERH